MVIYQYFRYRNFWPAPMVDTNLCVGMLCVVHEFVVSRHQKHRTVCNHL